jgi:serine/threonine protein kinase
METSIKNKGKCGSGTYGIVYKGLMKSVSADGEKKLTTVAVKRNFKESTTTGLNSIRELFMLATLKGHPFIINLISISYGDPFLSSRPMTPTQRLNIGMKDDSVNFVMDYVDTTLRSYIKSKECTADNIKIVLVQTLLGIEFMHSKNVTHRDLKPENILVNAESVEPLRVRIADFGLSQILDTQVQTPGVVTSWYRAPEICVGNQYGKNSDIWSFGCIMWELFTKNPYLNNTPDTSCKVFNRILERSPVNPDREVITSMMKTSGFLLETNASPIMRFSHMSSMVKDLVNTINFESQVIYQQQLTEATNMKRKKDIQKLNKQYQEWKTYGLPGNKKVEEFIKSFQLSIGSFEEYADLLGTLLQINPVNRSSASDALKHPFFYGMTDYIGEIHRMYKPILPQLPVITIVKCIERKWAANLAFFVYNKRKTLYTWYTHRIMFHSIDLFDKYMVWCYKPENLALVRKTEDKTSGRVHTFEETTLRFYVILYLMHKYYSTITFPLTFNKICPIRVCNSYTQLKEATEFEEKLISTVTENMIYRDTVYEMSSNYGHVLTEDMTATLLYKYGLVESWKNKSARFMYRTIMNFDTRGNKMPAAEKDISSDSLLSRMSVYSIPLDQEYIDYPITDVRPLPLRGV